MEDSLLNPTQIALLDSDWKAQSWMEGEMHPKSRARYGVVEEVPR